MHPGVIVQCKNGIIIGLMLPEIIVAADSRYRHDGEATFYVRNSADVGYFEDNESRMKGVSRCKSRRVVGDFYKRL